MNEILNEIRNIVFPDKCISCDRILTESERSYGFCRKCFKKINIIKEPCCKKCGKLLKKDIDTLCEDCKKRNHLFTQAKGVFSYDGPMKEIMYRFKYANKRYYARTFSYYAFRNYESWVRVNEIGSIVPVPMFMGKERKRGYNQAECFAKALGKEFSLPVQKHLVVRIKDTLPQKGLSDRKRHINLQNAFHINQKMLQSKRILLVDDIFTTGSTVDILTRGLLKAGVEQVFCMFICVGKGFKEADKNGSNELQVMRQTI